MWLSVCQRNPFFSLTSTLKKLWFKCAALQILVTFTRKTSEWKKKSLPIKIDYGPRRARLNLLFSPSPGFCLSSPSSSLFCLMISAATSSSDRGGMNEQRDRTKDGRYKILQLICSFFELLNAIVLINPNYGESIGFREIFVESSSMLGWGRNERMNERLSSPLPPPFQSQPPL